MGSLTVLFLFEGGTPTSQLSHVWERFNQLTDGDNWLDHIHDPTLEGYVVQPKPPDERLEVGKDMIAGRLYADGANERTIGAPDLPHLELRIEEALFRRPDAEGRREEYADALVDVLREAYFAFDSRPKVIYALPEPIQTAIVEYQDELPATVESLRTGRLNYPVWLTAFTPSLVETYGRETLLSAPAWRTYEWDDGSVVLVAYPDPKTPHLMDDIEEHLGLEPSGL